METKSIPQCFEVIKKDTRLQSCCKIHKFVPMKEQRKEKKLVEGEDFYYTPEGYKCFTEKHHLNRGYCCQSGCRHCPYGFDKNTAKIQK